MNNHITKPLLNIKGTYLRKRRRSKTMNSKMITNSQISTTESKKKKKKKKTKTKQTTRTGPESEKWTSHGGFSLGRGRGRMVNRRYRE